MKFPQIIAVAAAVVLSSTAFAQGEKMDEIAKTPPGVRAKIQTEMMKEKLQLTAEQTPKVEAINLTTAQQMQPVLEGGEGPMIRMRKARAIDEQKDAALQGVLLPPQYQQYLAMKDEMKQKLEEKLREKQQGGGQ